MYSRVNWCVLTVATLLVGVAAVAGASLLAGDARAAGATYAFDGFDTCEAPSTSNMSEWYQGSPYFFVGIYIGGENRACSNSDLTASWISTVHGQGWAFLPTWVGLQDPCWAGGGSTFSTNTSTAYSQGETAADNASSEASTLGFASGAVIYYDLEAYTQTTTCINAADSYMHGWDQQLAVKGYTPAVYGSSSGSDLTDLHNLTYAPTDAWAADWNSTDSVWGLSGLSNSYWVNDLRLHQYKGGHNETYNGVTISIDTDCSLGQEDMANTSYEEGSLYDTGSTNESNGTSEDATCQ